MVPKKSSKDRHSSHSTGEIPEESFSSSSRSAPSRASSTGNLPLMHRPPVPAEQGMTSRRQPSHGGSWEITPATQEESSSSRRRLSRAASPSIGSLPVTHEHVTGESSDPPENESRVLPQSSGWFEHVTVRAIIVSFVLSLLYVSVAMKLTLSTGIVPSLNISIGLVAFLIVKVWLMVVDDWALARRRFKPQENAIIQACVGAATSIVFSGGFGNYMFAMSSKVANQYLEASTMRDIKDLSLGGMITFLLAVSFVGFGMAIPFSEALIVDFRLPYPSGAASGHFINNLHTLRHAREEVSPLLISLACSFLWSGLRWIFTRGIGCGLVLPVPFPKAYENGFYLDLSAAYVGIGMLCSYKMNLYQLIGGILSSTILWPFFDGKKGDWYSSELESTSMQGLQGYKVFLVIATIAGEGVYQFCKILIFFFSGLYTRLYTGISGPRTRDDNQRYEVFKPRRIEYLTAFYYYVCWTAVAVTVVPWIFDHQLTWINIILIYCCAPVLAFSNAYGCGLTDLSITSVYGKMTIFSIGALVGASVGAGGVITCLAACGLVMSMVSTASDLLHDFTAGYMTLTSPRSIVTSQFIGIAMGCIICPCVFWFFSQSLDDLGILGSTYPVPYALVYRSMSALAIDGTSALPNHCLKFCGLFFVAALIITFAKDKLEGKKFVKFIPDPMVMAIGVLTRVVGAAPDSVASNFTLDMCFGNLITFIWWKCYKDYDEAHGLAVASGLICGEGIWALVSLCMALGGVKPPFCMKLLSDQEMTKLNIKQQ